MTSLPRFDHVGVTVTDLDAATAFFLALGLEEEGRADIEGDFIDTVIGIPGSRTRIVMLRSPGGGGGIELSCFERPPAGPGSPDAMATEVGLRSIALEVADVHAAVARVAEDGYAVVGGVGDHEGVWRMAYVRGPDGVLVALAQRL